MLILGIDIGTSSVKVSVMDAQSCECIASAYHPETEAESLSIKNGWAEQDPENWWSDLKKAILKCHSSDKYDPQNIAAIGIAYQMHGLVMIDKDQKVLRPSIIWCDSRAVDIGNNAFHELGKEYCLDNLLNSPGNFTASKLAWVKKEEPEVYKKLFKVMLPGDFISMKLTGEISSTVEALSEGTFWDFKKNKISKELMDHFDFDQDSLPEIKDVFSIHGLLKSNIAAELSLKDNIPVSYKAGDQPNNALSLDVLEPGEIAATAGTSGVIYGISDKLTFDQQSRINSFAHVNHSTDDCRIGVLLCINGVGILNKWIKNITNNSGTYSDMNNAISKVQSGSEGLRVLPFGNGAERMLNNKIVGSHICNIDLNIHSSAHLYRACQEGIAFAFRYGLDIMRENGMTPSVIRAGCANLFLSDPFLEAFVNVTNTPVQLYNSDGSIGAAIGAGLGAGIFKDRRLAFSGMRILKTVEPTRDHNYEIFYQDWKNILNNKMLAIN